MNMILEKEPIKQEYIRAFGMSEEEREALVEIMKQTTKK